MRGNWFLRALKVLVIAAVAVTVISFVTMHLWNWVMPAVFGLRTITWLQALALLVLGKILFGGFHRHGGGCHGRRWKGRMAERWMEMSPEERERFRAGMKGRWGCGFGPKSESQPEQKPV
jgi:hypothetical protein